MRAYAERFGEDPDEWGTVGLLHDADYERWPAEHPARIVAELRERGEGELADAVAAHYTKWGRPHDTLLAKALIASDELTGFVMACALVPVWALVFGQLRGIPPWWRVIDAAFGVVGFVPVWLCHRWTGELQGAEGRA